MTPYVRLETHIDVSGYGSELLTIADVDRDGRKEFIFVQGPGMLAADMFKPGARNPYGPAYTTPEDQALDCMTAVGLDGVVRWRQGTPWAGSRPYRQHGGDAMMLSEDIDGDGFPELIRIRGRSLAILDGSTGRVRRETVLDNDGYSQLLTARFTRDGTRHILVKSVGDGLDGHPHGCPVIAYDHRLRQVWGRRDFVQAGHTPGVHDVDGDGLDELLIGFQCARADGSILWTLPLSDGRGHPDRRVVADVNGDGKPEMVLACEDFGLVVASLDGKVLWRHPALHCGEACVGKFYADRPGLQVMGNDEAWRLGRDAGALASYMLDGGGTVIWKSEHDRYARPIPWPTSLGPEAMLAKPHAADPADARPFIMDGAGVILAEFDIPRTLPRYKDFALPHTMPVWGDWGDYYSYACVDLDGTGPRIVISSRTDLFVFKMGT